MSVTPASGTDAIGALAQQILKIFDTNRDGSIEPDEFASVLQAWLDRTRPTTTGGHGPTHSRLQSGEPGPSLEGFDFQKIPWRQTPKYQFARVAQQYGLAHVTDKASAQTLLEQMRSDLETEGLQVLAVKDDRLHLRLDGQDVWVDVIRGSCSGNPAFQWLPE